MRARVAAAHLRAQGHDVLIAAYGRVASVLRSHGFSVLDVRGLAACYRNGAVRRSATLARALRESPSSLCHNLHATLTTVKRFAPDVVLTDFSGYACLSGHFLGCPVLSLDHQHVIDRFQHPEDILAHGACGFKVARAMVKAKTWGCQHYLVTSFYFPEVRGDVQQTTTLTGPLIRPELEHLVPSNEDHVLVYQTAPGDSALLNALCSLRNVPFRVYGASICNVSPNVELRQFHEERFLKDLASARAVIANGGFTTLSEALYLGKPVLSIPIAHQWEQVLNAAWLERLGLGMRAQRPTAQVIHGFLERTSQFNRPRDQRLRTGTSDALKQLDRALAEVA
jgi:uncharacterized protein (TIGR00661 family)